MRTTTKLHTTGMHCKSCEIMLRGMQLKESKVAKVRSISSKTGIVSVDMPDEADESKIRGNGSNLEDIIS